MFFFLLTVVTVSSVSDPQEGDAGQQQRPTLHKNYLRDHKLKLDIRLVIISFCAFNIYCVNYTTLLKLKCGLFCKRV